VEGLIATLLAVGVIAALMVIGIRTKLPPPDLDWREHLPRRPPPPSRLSTILWLSRFGVLIAMILAGALDAMEVMFTFLGVWLLMTFSLSFLQLRRSLRYRRQVKP
jgi:hypothetical protein